MSPVLVFTTSVCVAARSRLSALYIIVPSSYVDYGGEIFCDKEDYDMM